MTMTLGMHGRKMLKLRNAMIAARWLTLGAGTVKPASTAMITGKGRLATLWEKKFEPAPQQTLLPRCFCEERSCGLCYNARVGILPPARHAACNVPIECCHMSEG
jgi:hypothetical protein